jgi:hypothetical protein
MAVILNASTSTGFIQTADTSGEIVLQNNGTTRLTVNASEVTIPTLSSTTITGTTVQGTIVQGTAVASTSGTSIDFTGIPSWVKQITILFSGISTSSTSLIQVQIGSGSFTTSGYAGGATNFSGGTQNASTTGFLLMAAVQASSIYSGRCVINLVTGNIYIGTSTIGSSTTSGTGGGYGAGTVTLGGILDRVRITTVGGTDTFDAGTINIQYEG